jgi:beta-lactamase class A
VNLDEPLREFGLTGSAYAASVHSALGIGFEEHELASPASVMKIQIALTIENLIAQGLLDAAEKIIVPNGPRTPGPTGMSLMHDEVVISVRDLVVAMLTISDNVATDELIRLAGLDEINRTTRALGMERTEITSDLREMLSTIALDVGFDSFASFVAHDPDVDSASSAEEIAMRIETSSALDPKRGTPTTAFETVAMLQAIWTNRAGEPDACRSVREIMEHQLTRNRIASGFSAATKVAAKSGALMGVLRNEAGVVVLPDGSAFAVAIFTRREKGNATNPSVIDGLIGRVARSLIDELQ